MSADRLTEYGFKKLENPYHVTCPYCGRDVLRTTNIPTKSCHCGAKLVFKKLVPEGVLPVWNEERA